MARASAFISFNSALTSLISFFDIVLKSIALISATRSSISTSRSDCSGINSVLSAFLIEIINRDSNLQWITKAKIANSFLIFRV